MGITDILLLIGIYLEIAVLSYFDYKMWGTLYTPLNFLMLPYAVVLAITLLVCGNWGIVDFYYPSLLVWMFGLLFFALPSYVMGLSLCKQMSGLNICEIEDNVNMRVLNIITSILILAFLYRFYSMVGSSPYLPGSEDFGYDFCGKGVWGHIHRVFHALSIIYIYKYDKKHKYYLLFISGMFFVTLMYGVKSWVLIPTIAGISMRLYSGKLKLRLSLILKVTLAAFSVFFITYSLSLLVGTEDSNEFEEVFAFICRVFIHYIISGIVGWSQDLQMGILERPNFDVLLTNILNIYHVIAGNEYVKSINPVFLFNGVNLSNTRSFFGTIYLHSNVFQFIVITIAASSIIYVLKICAMYSKGVFLNITYFFIAGMLIMGWFDYFLYTLPCLEVPVWVFILYLIARKKKNKDTLSDEALCNSKLIEQ